MMTTFLPTLHKINGVVYTKPNVVQFMLDLAGYTPDKSLASQRLLEPSYGHGSFLLEAIDRLLKSWNGQNLQQLSNAIRGVEIDAESAKYVTARITDKLQMYGFSKTDIDTLLSRWLVLGDYLTTPIDGDFDYVVGNPPYVRPENINSKKLQQYRKMYSTMTGRADLYIPFMQRSLELLSTSGTMCFICADAWVRNEYGKGIRSYISDGYQLNAYIDMYGLDSFETSIGAYPSITSISRATKLTKTFITKATSTDREYLKNLTKQLSEGSGPSIYADNVVDGAKPWHVHLSQSYEVIKKLEQQFPTLVDAGNNVGIGIATGADKVFIASDDLDIEDDRKLPLSTNKCVYGSHIEWDKKILVNPWDTYGQLINLDDYPKLHSYFMGHKATLERRHIAKKSPEDQWYKTIDKVKYELTAQPKILVPDIKNPKTTFTLDEGKFYPHHNLYYITSDEWNITGLFALLRSGIARMFVEAYSVRLGGGFVRYQAQYLKRIRVPYWHNLGPGQKQRLIQAGKEYEILPTAFIEEIYRLPSNALDFLKEIQ